MIVELTGVVADASSPAGTISKRVPTRQDIVLPRGEPLTIRLSVIVQDGTAYSLADVGVAIKLSARQFRDDEDAKFTRAATITTEALDEEDTIGKAELVILAEDTQDLYEFTPYGFDIQLTDGAGARWQIVPFSALKIAPVVNLPDDA